MVVRQPGSTRAALGARRGRGGGFDFLDLLLTLLDFEQTMGNY